MRDTVMLTKVEALAGAAAARVYPPNCGDRWYWDTPPDDEDNQGRAQELALQRILRGDPAGG